MGLSSAPTTARLPDAAQAEVVRFLAEEVDHDEVVGESRTPLPQTSDGLYGPQYSDDAVEASARLSRCRCANR